MSDALFEQPDAATPLSAEEREGLMIPVFNRQQLNQSEAINVASGRAWVLRSRRSWSTDSFLCELHRRMFGQVWNWAGKYRTTDKNIGDVPAYRVATDVRQTLDDARYQFEKQSYEPRELAVRLHHRLVWIHPFVNGNGRCTRLMADVVVKRARAKQLTWGGQELGSPSKLRAEYLEALKAADEHNYSLLLDFATR